MLSSNIAINLTRKQIEDSPSLDSDKPVSRQFEEEYMGIMAGHVLGRTVRVGTLSYMVRDRQRWTGSSPSVRKSGIPICAALTP